MMVGGLSAAQVADWGRDGVLVIEGFVDVARCDELIAHTAQIVEQVDRDIVSIFSTQEQTRTSDEWFLSSGDKVRALFEADAFDADGNLRQPIDVSINKLVYAMHDYPTDFLRFSRTPHLADVPSAVDLGAPH